MKELMLWCHEDKNNIKEREYVTAVLNEANIRTEKNFHSCQPYITVDEKDYKKAIAIIFKLHKKGRIINGYWINENNRLEYPGATLVAGLYNVKLDEEDVKTILTVLRKKKNGLREETIKNFLLEGKTLDQISVKTATFLIKIIKTMREIEEITGEKAKLFFGPNITDRLEIGLECLPTELKKEYLKCIYYIVENNLPSKLGNYGMVGTKDQSIQIKK
jgi:hypothetical protein